MQIFARASDTKAGKSSSSAEPKSPALSEPAGRERQRTHLPHNQAAVPFATPSVSSHPSEDRGIHSREIAWDFSKVPIFPLVQPATSRPAHAAAPFLIQPMLAIGAISDPLEYEADQVADQVMRMPVPWLQRKCACGDTFGECSKEHSDGEHEPIRMKHVIGPARPALTEAPPIVHEVLRSPGQPLDGVTRAFMEPRFGHDFSRIRIHTDAVAGESAKAIQALAYTSDNQIIFAPGQYQPHSSKGAQLLAHELTHTLQQGGFVRRQPSPTEEKPPVHAFAGDNRMRTWRRYARSEAQKDAARIRQAGKLSAEDRQLIDAKLGFFEGEAKEIYVREIEPVLLQFVPRPEIEMPEKYLGKLSPKERRQLEHRRYLTTAYFSRKQEYEYLLKDAYLKGVQSLLDGDDSLDFETMEGIVQQRFPNAPWHVKARQEFLAHRQEQVQQQEAKRQAGEQAHEHQRLLPQLPEYWQIQIGALSEQTQPWPEEAQLLAQGLLWRWYELRRKAYPANPALVLPGIEGDIEATIRKELLSDFESVLRAADRTIQQECAKNPPSWMEKIHGDPCVSLFAPFGRAESALNDLERRLKIFRDGDGEPYKTVFNWGQEYQKQQVPTSMAGRYLELLQARARLGQALSLAVSPTPLAGLRPPATAGIAGALGEASLGEAALGEAALGEAARRGVFAPPAVEPVAPSGVAKDASGLRFPRTDLTRGRAFAPPAVEPPAPAPVPLGRAPAGPPSGIGNWLRSKVLEYTMRGVDVSEVAPGIRAGGGPGTRPVPAEVGGATPSPTPTPGPVVPSQPATVTPSSTGRSVATGADLGPPALATSTPGIATGGSTQAQIGQMIGEATAGLSQPGGTPLDPQALGPSTPGGPSSPPSGSSSPSPTPSGSSSPSPTPSGSTLPRNLGGGTMSMPSPLTVKPSSLSQSHTGATTAAIAFTPPGPHRVLEAHDYDAKPIKEGANRGKLLLTHKATGQKFLFKPRSGEVDIIGGNVGIVSGERYRRAPAAAYLAREAGIPSPAAEIAIWRAGGKDEIGSLQDWITEGQAAEKFYGQPLYRAADRSQLKLDLDAFDYVIANMDRNPGNWKIVLDPQTNAVQRVIPIDMDASLPPGPGRYSHGQVMEPFQPALPATISHGLYDRLLQMSANRTTIEKELQPFLHASEIQGVFTRLDELLQNIQGGHIHVVP